MNLSAWLPQRLIVEANAVAQLPAVLNEFSLTSPLIITDSFIKECGYLARVTDILSQAGFSHGEFTDCVPDPTTDSVGAALAMFRQGNFDCVIGFGGGSSIDTAKAVSVLAQHGGEMKDYKAPNQVPIGVPIFAIPTTAGTGSEASRVTVVTDVESGEKMMCAGAGLLPRAAFVDYTFTLSMPPRLTADTALDSLCHAIEAYVSRKANTLADGFALQAMQLITHWLPVIWQEPDNQQGRESLMYAATLGGLAFSNSSVTLIHGMSRPLGAFFHVPHGMSNAMLLTEVTRFSLAHASARYRECAIIMGFAAEHDDEVRAGEKLVAGLSDLVRMTQVPTPGEFGIDKETWSSSMNTMAEQALASGSPATSA